MANSSTSRLAPEHPASPQRLPPNPGERVVGALRIIVWFVVTIIWSIVGLIFWIPFLARMIAIFTAAVVASTLTDADLTPADMPERSAGVAPLRPPYIIC